MVITASAALRTTLRLRECSFPGLASSSTVWVLVELELACSGSEKCCERWCEESGVLRRKVVEVLRVHYYQQGGWRWLDLNSPQGQGVLAQIKELRRFGWKCMRHLSNL